MAELAGPQASEFQESDLDPPEFFHHVAQPLDHSPDLVLSALGERDLEPRVLSGLDAPDAGGSGGPAIEPDALTEFSQLVVAGIAVDLNQISLRNELSAREDYVRELAVIGEQ